MDLSKHTAPVLTDPVPINKSRLGVHSSVFPYTPGTMYSNLFLAIPRKKTGILDDVRSSSWLDAMKSSSPPHKRITKGLTNELASADTDVAYRTWMLKYPSALGCFEQIANFAKGKRIALFLDYDGTLSPIVDNPDCAFMSSASALEERKLVRDEAKNAERLAMQNFQEKSSISKVYSKTSTKMSKHLSDSDFAQCVRVNKSEALIQGVQIQAHRVGVHRHDVGDANAALKYGPRVDPFLISDCIFPFSKTVTDLMKLINCNSYNIHQQIN